MNAPVTAVRQKRGACPGLSAPMATGDGLLVRMTPVGTIPLNAFAEFCAAAHIHGNGVIEITARGNIQVRGLSAASAPRFAAAVAALGIAADDGVPVLCNPLAGLDPEEIIDAAALAADLRAALARTALTQTLSAKVSVIIDGGGKLNLDAIAADIRLRAEAENGSRAFRIEIGGEDIGFVDVEHGVEAARPLLGALSEHGNNVRARDIIAAEGTAPFSSAIFDLLQMPARDLKKSGTRPAGETIGLHRLQDGSFACGIGLGFGHTDVASLQRLVDAAKAAAARGIRVAPDRALLVIGLKEAALASFTAAAKRLGFIVRADDPRRCVIACAGAPICASAHIAARTIAPIVAAATAPHLNGSFRIHVSGCVKGCAYQATAALTIVGMSNGCALVAYGTARDTPFMTTAANELPATVARFVRDRRRETDHA